MFWGSEMNSEIEQAAGIDRRAAAAKESEEAMERLIEDFRPFLQARAAKYSMSTDSDRRDELFSTAMIAFYESVQNYDITRGHFFQYAQRVVRARLIDYIRGIYRSEGNTVSLDQGLDDENENQQSESPVVIELSMRSYDRNRGNEALVDEIEQFKAELNTWGITMEALSRNSPKHKKLRETYKEIVLKITNEPDIVQTIQLKRYFPVKTVAEITGLPQKNVERARTYILATLIIRLGEYDLLSGYIAD